MLKNIKEYFFIFETHSCVKSKSIFNFRGKIDSFWVAPESGLIGQAKKLAPFRVYFRESLQNKTKNIFLSRILKMTEAVFKNHEELAYLDLCKKIIETGNEKGLQIFISGIIFSIIIRLSEEITTRFIFQAVFVL